MHYTPPPTRHDGSVPEWPPAERPNSADPPSELTKPPALHPAYSGPTQALRRPDWTHPMTAALSPPLAAPTATRSGILYMLMAILLFTTMDALAKYLIAFYPTWQIIWVRFIGQTLLVAIFLNRRLPALLRTRHPRLQALRSLCQFGATGLFFLALGYIGLAEAHALTDINPILITLGAALFLDERLGPRRIFGVLLALTGAMIVIRPGLGVFSPAALLPIACAVCYAAYALTTRYMGPQENIWTSIFYASLLGTVVTSLMMPFVAVPISLSHLPLFAGIALLGTGAQICLVRAYTLAEASVIAPFGYAGILFATVWGIIIFGEYPDRWTVIGALVIVGAGLYVWHRETRAARTA